jgi:hypothetical protein
MASFSRAIIADRSANGSGKTMTESHRKRRGGPWSGDDDGSANGQHSGRPSPAFNSDSAPISSSKHPNSVIFLRDHAL